MVLITLEKEGNNCANKKSMESEPTNGEGGSTVRILCSGRTVMKAVITKRASAFRNLGGVK